MGLENIQTQLSNRFFRYLAISSQSDSMSNTIPTSAGQITLASLLAQELAQYGLEEIHIDQNGSLTAVKRAPLQNTPAANTPKIGFVAHLDTVDVGLSADIKPQIINFKGDDLCLNHEQDIWLKTKAHPEILKYMHEDIIFSDGTSVLGADNKAAITVIMELLASLKANPCTTCDIYVAFVPDEEIGLRGSKILDLTRFKPDFAYTIDCCELGEVVYETFNGASIEVNITGITAHPMSAKNVLVNPIRVMHDLMGYFDRHDTPEHTEGREGYFWFNDINANQSTANLKISIRDFDLIGFNARKDFFAQAVKLTQARHPRAQISYVITDIYGNISNSIKDNSHPSIDLLLSAMASLNIKPNIIPMRGGTDGSALSPRGLITPNYFTGAHNFHSCFEFLPISAFVKSFELTKSICMLAARSNDFN
ncbi:peptidase T [Gammaproteobacteria bacterium]|nr:peptidase T [Gammaproteobacteria bacterium]